MKKKVLFIMPSLKSGGAEKALVTLLNLFDFEKYDVDLLLFRREGLFLPQLPAEVTVYDAGESYAVFDGAAAAAAKIFCKKLKPQLAAKRLRYSRLITAPESEEKRRKIWDILGSVIEVPQKEYDTAVAYLEGNSIYCCVDKINAANKIGYIHNDYNFLGLNAGFDRGYFKKLNGIVTVSEVCRRSLCEVFPEFGEKIKVIYNIVSPAMLQKYAAAGKGFDDGYAGKRLLTVGRFAEQKGLDLAVEACKILADKGLEFRWYHIGTGELREQIMCLVQKLGVTERFVFLGEKENPYPFTSQCDIYVQPSRFEGKSIAIDEAKIFARPVVTTAYPTVADQITDGENGIVCRITAADIAAGIEKLLLDEGLCERLSASLMREKAGNEEEMEKLFEIL